MQAPGAGRSARMTGASADDWYLRLPRRRCGSGVLIVGARARILIVEPRYKSTWEIPGGVVELGEDPRTTCRRECAEELGIEVLPGRLLVLEHKVEPLPRGDAIMFVYDGGVVDDASAFQLQEDELASVRFVDVDDVDDVEEYLSAGLARRMRAAHRARQHGSMVELVDGVEQ